MAVYGDQPGVTVEDISRMTKDQIDATVAKAGDIILAWCNSERCGMVLRALGIQ